MPACRNVDGHEEFLVAGVAEISAFDVRRLCSRAVTVAIAEIGGHGEAAPGVLVTGTSLDVRR